jgi:hypothetical protein
MGFPGVGHYLPDNVYAVLARRLGDRSADELLVQTEECLKFLIITSESVPQFIPMTREVDEVWHELILQTYFYAQLCEGLPGHRFIHHQTLEIAEYAASDTKRDLVSELVSWIPAYVSRFGPFTPERARYWSVVQYFHDKHGISLETLNSVGVGAAA